MSLKTDHVKVLEVATPSVEKNTQWTNSPIAEEKGWLTAVSRPDIRRSRLRVGSS